MRENLKNGLSIIIPAYNAQNTIQRAISSVLNQTLENIEVIIIIDGATDNTLEVCKKIQKSDNRIKIIEQENQGAFIARKIGIKEASGEYIMFLDADDCLKENAIIRLLEVIKTYHTDLIRFRYEKIPDGYEQYHYFEEKEKYIKKENFKNLVYPMFLDGYMLNAIWTNCVKKEIFYKFSIAEEKIRYGEDLQLNLEIFSYLDNAVFLDDILYQYITTNNSTTNTRNVEKLLRNLRDCISIYTLLYDYLKKWDMNNSENIRKVRKRIIKETDILMDIIYQQIN